MKTKHILLVIFLYSIITGFSKSTLYNKILGDNLKGITENTDTLQDQTYCIDNSHYTEFYYNNDNASATYQWQSNDGSGFINLSNNANFSGVNTNTLGISFIDATYDGLLIRCLVTISSVTDTSNSATLFVREPFFNEENYEICLGEAYNWHNLILTDSGTYYDSLLTIGGCDSVYKLNLTKITNTIYDTIIVCANDSAFLENEWQTQAGTYIDTVVYTSACDTIVQTELYFKYGYSSNTQTICEGDSILLGGTYQTQAGIYTDTIEYVNACDTIYETELFIEYSSSSNVLTICEGDSVFLGGAWQTQPGFYTDNYTSANGCNITLLTHLSTTISKDSTISRNICEGDHFLFNGQTYSEAGTYSHTEPSSNGCDSTVTLNLTVSADPNINATATPSSILPGESSELYIEDEGTITWYSNDTTISCTDCNNPIVSPTENTTYVVVTQIGFCEYTDSVSITIKKPEFAVDIPEGFSPNKDGINDAFEIKYLEEFPYNEIKIMNRWGHKVFEAKPYVNNWRGTNFFGMAIGEDLPEGTYFYILKLNDEDNQIFKGYVYIKR